MSVPHDIVRAQLQKLLASPDFARSASLTKLLRFVVEETLQGRHSELKETQIGLEALARPASSYDAAIDPIVRVQMGRLRQRLRNYYSAAGAGDPIIIDLPRGSYVPSFQLRSAAQEVRPAGEPSKRTPATHRLAVLPFVNMSPTPGSDYFSDGLTEELINVLARDRSLEVVARTSTFQFKQHVRDIREIGRQLDAGKILEGSVRISGCRVRITVQLIDSITGCHLWSERYDRELTDIFAIHDEIAAAIHRALKPQLAGPAELRGPSRRAAPLDAYNHYLQGRFLWNKRTEAGLRTAIGHFAEAVRLDPTFARAYSGMADCHVLLGMSATESPDRCMTAARAAARQSLALDNDSAEAHTSLAGVLNCYEWDRSAAREAYQRAQALDPTYATAHHWNGIFNLATAGQFAAAIEELELAMDLDPLSAPIICDLALVHCFRGEAGVAEPLVARALELDPHFHRPYLVRGLGLASAGDYRAAATALQDALARCPDNAFRSRVSGALGFCHAKAGRLRPAQTLRRELESAAATRYVARFDVAQVHAGEGNHAAALAELEAAVAGRESFAVFIGVWPTFRALRSSGRFAEIVAAVERGSPMLR